MVVGAGLGAGMDNTPTGIAICSAAGACAAYVWDLMEQRKLKDR